MDSEDSRDGRGDARSSSSSSSSTSSRRSRRSSSSEKSDVSDKNVPPKNPSFGEPRSPSPESRSQSSGPPLGKPPQSPDNLSQAHSDINSPENSMPNSPAGPQSPDGPKSPSELGSNIASPDQVDQYSSAPQLTREGPKTPCSPSSSAKSAPNSPDNRSHPASPDSASGVTSLPFRKHNINSHNSSPASERNSIRSPSKSPTPKKNQWSPKEKWRRHTKAEQKMVPQVRSRSRSESSQSSRSSSYNKRSKDPVTEEISEGEMESDQEDTKSRTKSGLSDRNVGKDLNMSHEDLSDVSDLDSMGADENIKDLKPRSSPTSPERNQDVCINGKKSTSTHSSPKSDIKMELSKLEKVPQEKTSNTEDCEEQLDFEAEEGECVEPKPKEDINGEVSTQELEKEEVKPDRRSRGSSLEEGEVSDEGERRPEESEPRPVCRFFSRGACTWGISCRFLHPGVTDKGNYNMFDVIRGVLSSGPYTVVSRDAAPPESAWERGLRTAKEMLRIANKRKEQDMDFEEKKLHLSVGGVVHDPDAELAYAAAAVGASPPAPAHLDAAPLDHARGPHPHPHSHSHPHPHPHPHSHPHPHRDPEAFRYGPMYRGRYGRAGPEEREHFYERGERGFERGERGFERGERGFERMPQYDDRVPPNEDPAYHKRRVRASREVIVQRAEGERREVREGREPRREGRGDEWADPWMRAEAAARRRRHASSDESYSSTSTSNSSSRSSRSPGSRRKKRVSPSSRQRLSPSVIVRERRLAVARATAMNPPAPRRRAPSPVAARLAANPPPPANLRHKDEMDTYGRKGRNRDKRYSRSSTSGSESSSTSSESESESHSSSTSGSSGARRARHARLLNAAARPRVNAKSNTGLAATVSNVSKKEVPTEKEPSAKKRAATSPGGAPPKKSVSRREELLKQLKAVEDAIARKRSKI